MSRSRISIILHLCNRKEWEKAQAEGEYRPASLETEGFIHASRPEQILGVANRYYRGAVDLVLLQIEAHLLQAEIRWEATDGDEYPHIYGPINLEAITAVLPIIADQDGEFRQLPNIGSSPLS